MIFQTAILQPIIQFISAVLWADDKYERVGVSYRFPALGSRLFSLVPHNLIKPWPWPCWCDPTSGIDNCSRKLRAPVYDILPSLLGWRCRKAMFWECYDPIIMGIDNCSLKLPAPVYDILPSLLGWRCRKAMFWECYDPIIMGIDNCSLKLPAPVYDILPSLLGWRCRKAMFWECYDPIIMGIDKYSLKLQARHPSKGAGKRGLECDAVSACTLRTDSVSTSYLEAAYIKPLI